MRFSFFVVSNAFVFLLWKTHLTMYDLLYMLWYSCISAMFFLFFVFKTHFKVYDVDCNFGLSFTFAMLDCLFGHFLIKNNKEIFSRQPPSPLSQFSLRFLIKTNKEISSREVRGLQVNFPYGFFSKTIRKSPPGSSGASRSIFLMVSC